MREPEPIMRTGSVREVAAPDTARDWRAEALHWRRTARQIERLVRLGSFEYVYGTGALAWSEGTYAVFGLPPGSPVSIDQALAFYDPDVRSEISRMIDAARHSGEPYDLTVPFRSATGEAGWVRMVGEVETIGEASRLVGVVRDITCEREAEDCLRREANQDVLTGLPNRRAFLSHLDRALAKRDDVPFALCLVDVDRFKVVNDTHGHAAGDGLLREVARRLSGAVRPTDVVARLGGDEFAVLLLEVDRTAVLRRLASLLVTSARRPFDTAGVRFRSSVSVGACLSPPDGAGPDALLGQADAALYAAKLAGRDGFSLFGSVPARLARSCVADRMHSGGTAAVS